MSYAIIHSPNTASEHRNTRRLTASRKANWKFRFDLSILIAAMRMKNSTIDMYHHLIKMKFFLFENYIISFSYCKHIWLHTHFKIRIVTTRLYLLQVLLYSSELDVWCSTPPTLSLRFFCSTFSSSSSLMFSHSYYSLRSCKVYPSLLSADLLLHIHTCSYHR